MIWPVFILLKGDGRWTARIEYMLKKNEIDSGLLQAGFTDVVWPEYTDRIDESLNCLNIQTFFGRNIKTKYNFHIVLPLDLGIVFEMLVKLMCPCI